MDITEAQQDQIEKIIRLVDSPKRGEPLTGAVMDDIVIRLKQLLSENAALDAFLASVKESVSARALLEWSAPENELSLRDVPNGKLSEKLKEIG